MSDERDHVMPSGPWQFDKQVTDVFDDMLRRSIPQYNAMRMVVFELGRHFARPGTAIIDMGCSRGEALEPFVSMIGAANDYLGLEIPNNFIVGYGLDYDGFGRNYPDIYKIV